MVVFLPGTHLILGVVPTVAASCPRMAMACDVALRVSSSEALSAILCATCVSVWRLYALRLSFTCVARQRSPS